MRLFGNALPRYLQAMVGYRVGFEYHWRTEQGTRGDDNWDYCGIGLRSEVAICIVLDGATTGAKSGEFARQVATQLIDWFIEAKGPLTADAIIDQLLELHKVLIPDFRSASASYAIILIEPEKPLVILHAGDCLVGQLHGTPPVRWETRPHTLANATQNIPIAEIANSPLRNRLTRSLRAREFLKPDESSINPKGDAAIIVGSDGFWADLEPNDQISFLDGATLNGKDQDDCSVLKISPLAVNQKSKVSSETSKNIYVVDSR